MRAFAEDIDVGVSSEHYKTDAEIAEAVLHALKWNTTIPEDQIYIQVEDGMVKLEGETEWDFQGSSSRSVVENLAGVRSVVNLITVKPRLSAENIHHQIMKALERHATIDAGKIHVLVKGNTVSGSKIHPFIRGSRD